MDGKPLPLEQLIGAPLRALVLAQGIAAQTSADFVSEVGFNSATGGRPPSARTVEFTYVHPAPDPANPGGVIDTPVRVSVPLLTLTSVPNIALSEATVDFGVNVVNLKAIQDKRNSVAIESAPPSAFPPPVQLIAVYAGPSTSATISFSIKAAKEPLAEGLARVLVLLQDAITATPVNK